jgi:hypothetical protein
MGPTLVSVPVSGVGQMPLPVIRVVDELLRQLMEETKRLIREKEFVVHAVANALLEKEELIGPELDDVFRYAELSHPDGEKAFERRPIVLRRPFEQLEREEHAAIPAVVQAAAAETPPTERR